MEVEQFWSFDWTQIEYSDLKLPGAQYLMPCSRRTGMSHLKEYPLLPFDRLGEIMRDLFACDSFSEGTLANFDANCSRRLEPVETAIHDLAAASPVAGFDETGVRATGSLHGLHTVSTQRVTGICG